MSRDVTVLAAIFTGMGVGHFVKPEPFEAIVPKQLPYKRELVYASGLAELTCAALLLNPRTRRLGGAASVALLSAVFPANVQMAISALRSSRTSGLFKAGTIARLPLQVPLIRIAVKAARG